MPKTVKIARQEPNSDPDPAEDDDSEDAEEEHEYRESDELEDVTRHPAICKAVSFDAICAMEKLSLRDRARG